MANPIAITDYASLVAAVEEYMLEQDIQANDVPLWISTVEKHANNEIRSREMQVLPSSASQFVAGEGSIALPSDFIETFRFYYFTDASGEIMLELVSPQQVREFRSPDTGRPRNFAIAGETLELAPIPDGAYNYFFEYYQKIPALTATNTTNWLLTKHPLYYLYGTLTEGYRFYRDDAQLAKYEPAFQKEGSDIVAVDQRAMWRPFSRIRRDSYPERRRIY